MVDITVFPTRHSILVTDPKIANLKTFTVKTGETVKAGMVLELDPSSGDNIVTPGDSDDAGPVVGVALYGATAGKPVTVCCAGTICYVANESDSAAINEGSLLQLADVNVGGAVVIYTSGAGYIVGVALEAIAAGGWGRALIMPYEQVVA